MFDVSWSEMLIVGVLALIFVGPKDLPRMMREVGRWVGKARGMARQFQRAMDDAAREADLDELRDAGKSLRDLKTSVGDPIRWGDVGAKPAAKTEAKASAAAPAETPPPASPVAPSAPTSPEASENKPS